MTTIAFDGKTIAADTMSAGGAYVSSVKSKIFKHDGVIYGCAGQSQCIAEFRHWVESGQPQKEKPVFQEETFSALIISREGTVSFFENRLFPYEVEIPTAIGSGGCYAIAAMKAGAAARKAVEIACDLDEATGGKITTMTVSKRG